MGQNFRDALLLAGTGCGATVIYLYLMFGEFSGSFFAATVVLYMAHEFALWLEQTK